MANETISQLPLAIAVSGQNDLVEISQYTGAPGTGYTSKKAAIQLISNTFIGQVPVAVEYVITNGGNVLIGGVQPYISVPFNATITSASLICSPAGSITVNIWRCTFGQFDGGVTHPSAGDSICGGNPLSIVSGTKVQGVLTGWTTAVNQGDVLAFYVTPSPSLVTGATVILYLSRTIP